MTSYATPARVRFPRSDVTGAVPLSLAPGSFALNWADRKIYVGDEGGQPVRFGQWLDDWDPTLSYRIGDFVLRNNEIYRATMDMAAGTPFAIGPWQVSTGSDRARASEPVATSIVAGGLVTVDSGQLAVAAGTGIAVGLGDPPVITDVVWGATILPATGGTSAWGVVSVSTTGVIEVSDLSVATPAWRREHIVLAFVLRNNAGSIQSLLNISPRAGQTAEAFRDSYEVDGGAYRARGLRMTVTPEFGLNLTAGEIFALGAFWRTSATSPNTLSLAMRNNPMLAYESRDRLRANRATLDPAQWDNAGNMAAVPAGQVTIQFVTMLPDQTLHVQYGQTLYASQSAALAEIERAWAAFVPYAGAGPAVVLGAAIMRSDAAATGDVIIVGAASRNDPFTVTPTTGASQFLLLDGSRPMVGDLDMGGNDIENAVMDGGIF